MISAQHIEAAIQEHVKSIDAYIVEIKVLPGNKIEVSIDKESGKINISDCVSVSRFIENHFDREKEDYSLEVGSPGATEPFKVIKQYIKHVGREVTVITTDGQNIAGKISDATKDNVTITTTRIEKAAKGTKGKQTIIENITLNYPQIKETTLVLSFK